MLRQGTCNRCGQCCGGIDAPNARTPFASTWWQSVRHWSLDDVNEMCPQLTMFGLTQVGEDTLGVESNHGSYKVQGKNYYYVWVDGLGIQKDISAAHDGSEYNCECPFLLPDPGDGTRPCALVGTNDDGAYKKWCENEPVSPRSAKLVAQWQAFYPACSYTWVEE